MSNVMIDSSYMTGIANAIRGKNGTQNTYLPSEMPSAITNIPTGTGTVVPNFPTSNNTNNIWVLIDKAPTTVTATLKTSGDTVNWGDGITDTNTTHTYTNTGMYCIQADSLYTVDENIINAEFNHTTTDINSLSFTSSATLTNLKVSTTDYTTIATNAFRNCISLTTVNFPNILTTINNGAFINCTSLTGSISSTNITSIGFAAFYHTKITSVNVPNATITGASSTEGGAFQGCTSLISAIVGELGNEISNAFNGCTALTTVTVNGGTTIGSSAFKGCTSLTTLTIPASVTNIGSSAFQKCTSMQEYHFLPTTPPTLAHTNAFSNIPSNCIIYVPVGSLEAYQTAQKWSTYASYIQAEPTT